MTLFLTENGLKIPRYRCSETVVAIHQFTCIFLHPNNYYLFVCHSSIFPAPYLLFCDYYAYLTIR